jgi:hypothetical protein
VFPVKYELNLYILFRRNSIFNGLNERTCITVTEGGGGFPCKASGPF